MRYVHRNLANCNTTVNCTKNPILKRLKIGQSEMARFDRPHTTSYCQSVITTYLSCSFQYITTVSVYESSDLEKSFSFETVEITGYVRLVMAALCNRAGHYIFALWFLSFFISSYIFFPRLISAAEDWMSTILRHLVWAQCEFRMQV